MRDFSNTLKQLRYYEDPLDSNDAVFILAEALERDARESESINEANKLKQDKEAMKHIIGLFNCFGRMTPTLDCLRNEIIVDLKSYVAIHGECSQLKIILGR